MSAANERIDHVGRIIDRHYLTRDGQLVIGGIAVGELAAQFGTPLFVYDQTVIQQTVARVRETLPADFDLFYSIKANPNAAILRTMVQADCGLEVASAGELHQALAAGCPADRILFAGPGKVDSELSAAIDARIHEIHVESIDEARRIDRLAGDRKCVAAIGLRINPLEASGGAMRMGGRASPFGIDEEELPAAIAEIQQLEHVRVTGVHLFMATQILDAATLLTQYERAVAIAERVAMAIGHPLQTIDFGGGWGTPYFAHESELDLDQVATGLRDVADQIRRTPLLSAARGLIELGRFLVNESGLYLCRVTSVKISRGKTFAIVDGGMHHHLAASGNLGQTIKRNYPVALVNRLGQPAARAVEVVGPLCTPLDQLGRQLQLPEVRPGDLLGVFQSGAYGRTSSPHGFLSHPSPAEVLAGNGKANIIRRRGIDSDLFTDQIPSGHLDPPSDAPSQGATDRW